MVRMLPIFKYSSLKTKEAQKATKEAEEGSRLISGSNMETSSPKEFRQIATVSVVAIGFVPLLAVFVIGIFSFASGVVLMNENQPPKQDLWVNIGFGIFAMFVSFLG